MTKTRCRRLSLNEDKTKALQHVNKFDKEKTSKRFCEAPKETSLVNAKPSYLSRGQRKRTEKLERLQRKKNFIAYMNRLREEEMVTKQYGAFSEFNDIKACLSEAAEACEKEKQKTKGKPCKRKARNLSMDNERARFQAILQYSPYREDPLGVICQHLSNTLF